MGGLNAITTRDASAHRPLRGIWEQGFKSNSIREYSTRVELHVDRFIRILEQTKGKFVDCVPLVTNMTFDIMADLSFGTDYGMQAGTGDPSYMGYLHDYLCALSVTGSLRTLCDFMTVLPYDKATAEYRKQGEKLLDGRIAMGKSRPDIFTHLLGEDIETGKKLTYSELNANAQLLIVAGSDTTSTVLSNVFRELSLHPDVQEKLYQEIHAAAEAGPFDCQNTKNLPYLQAVIDETLRLWPPVPAGAQAQTGPAGATIAGRFVPPLTAVRVHHLALMSDDRYFPQGERFWPERWTESREDGVKDVRAFIPFSFGTHVCVGKHLAYNELRLTVARVSQKFKIELGPNYDDQQYRKACKDYFTIMIGSVEARFVPRI
ncbi:cytochrome P450 [Sphaerosporella brunnea]|uniref:Cytochrome P450 n=1 Tax=Sphaerosporella brunnea TaxID=1250544 RepID=A0A5J5EDC2_9PEZI|nr:cytochrome P450 [Sphaerosporella brunnea]